MSLARPSLDQLGVTAMILLRHGQSEFNLLFTQTRKDPGIIDPKLTPLGQTQAEEAAEALAHEGIRRIIVSPYTRALQTALPVARRLKLPLTVTPTVRERYAFTCDIGRPVAELRMDFPHVVLDHIDEIWWPPVEEPAEQVIDRAQLFRAEMAAVIAHVKASPPADPDQPVLVAGEKERATRAARLAGGIPVDGTTWDILADTARSLGINAIPAPEPF